MSSLPTPTQLELQPSPSTFSGRSRNSVRVAFGCGQNRCVKLINGFTFMMPDRLEKMTAYPQQTAQKPGIGFPNARCVGSICRKKGDIRKWDHAAAALPCQGSGLG
jgi:hypothetical protein